MYDELISSLRICRRINSVNDNCIAFHDGSCEAEPVCMYELMDKAADAIEELSKQHEAQRQNLIVLMNDKPRWIPVAERLPQGGDDSGQLCENVLLQMSVEYNDNYVTSGWINGITKKVYYLDEEDDFIHRADMSVVKAWMPLPEPPKEEV